MGGTQSTEAAAAATNGHGTNGNSRRDVYANLERRDSEDDDCECTLFSFCNPGSKSGSKTKKKTASDLLGTPLLTPKLGDRRKQRGAQDAKAQQPTLFMSRYGGLEKEPSADAGDAAGSSWERAPSAVVHEGSVSYRFWYGVGCRIVQSKMRMVLPCQCRWLLLHHACL